MELGQHSLLEAVFPGHSNAVTGFETMPKGQDVWVFPWTAPLSYGGCQAPSLRRGRCNRDVPLRWIFREQNLTGV